MNELLDDFPELIRCMVQNNRRTEALSYANEMRWDIDNRLDMKASVTQRAQAEIGRSMALASNDDYDGAMSAVDAAIAGYRKANLASYSGYVADALALARSINCLEAERQPILDAKGIGVSRLARRR